MPVFKRNTKLLDDKIRGLVEIDADTSFMGMEAKEEEFELHVEQNRFMHKPSLWSLIVKYYKK